MQARSHQSWGSSLLSRSGVALVLFSLAAGCFAPEDGGSNETRGSAALVAGPCSDVAGTDIARSLVVTDRGILDKFSFTRVMNQIRTSADVASTETLNGIYRRWMRTFGASPAAGDCDDPTIDPNHYGLVCPREPELKLSTFNPFVSTATLTFEPIALFNRFDLAPANGAHCGEYRIVYAMKGFSPNITGRAFIIFEATLPNPTPANGIDSCLPVARFWQDLTNDANVSSRATKLQRFYFGGTAIDGFEPVVKAAHYGLATNTTIPTASGQVRTNFFIDNREWQLREFKLNRQCTDEANPETCKLTFAHVPVKANPAEELFAGTHAKSASFRAAFINQIPGLAAANINRVRMSTANAFNELESVSSSINVAYSIFANAQIRSDVSARLSASQSTLTADNIFDRATTQTCAGCHQVASGRPLGNGLTWPLSLGFVHVDEQSRLSPALTDVFLPNRKKVLEKFINDRCGAAEAGAPSVVLTESPATASVSEASATGAVGPATVGGSAEGAAN